MPGMKQRKMFRPNKPLRTKPVQVKRKKDRAVRFGRVMGQALGNHFGGPVGGEIGKRVGSNAGRLFTRITGWGDYKVSRNSIVKGNGTGTPHFTASRHGGCRLAHAEYIRDIVSSDTIGEWKPETFTINPSDPLTFPWLQTIARGFTSYKVHGMVFHYRPTSGTAVGSTNAALGVVSMATRYDVLSSDFESRRQMEQSEFSNSTVPCQDALHAIECDPRETPLEHLYCRGTGAVTTNDERFHDLGQFTISSEGCQAASVTLGELWVSYDIEFIKPVGNNSSSVQAKLVAYNVDPSFGPIGDITSANFAITPESTLDIKFVGGDMVILPGPGYYLCEFYVECKSSTGTLAIVSGWASSATAFSSDRDILAGEGGSSKTVLTVESSSTGSPRNLACVRVLRVDHGTGTVGLPLWTNVAVSSAGATVIITRLPSFKDVKDLSLYPLARFGTKRPVAEMKLARAVSRLADTVPTTCLSTLDGLSPADTGDSFPTTPLSAEDEYIQVRVRKGSTKDPSRGK